MWNLKALAENGCPDDEKQDGVGRNVSVVSKNIRFLRLIWEAENTIVRSCEAAVSKTRLINQRLEIELGDEFMRQERNENRAGTQQLLFLPTTLGWKYPPNNR